jgi:hypothetical protein
MNSSSVCCLLDCVLAKNAVLTTANMCARPRDKMHSVSSFSPKKLKIKASKSEDLLRCVLAISLRHKHANTPSVLWSKLYNKPSRIMCVCVCVCVCVLAYV